MRTISKTNRAILIFLGLIALVYLVLLAIIKFDEVSSRLSSSQVDSLSVHSKKLHHLTLLDSGTASLWKRIELIRSAQKTIDLEFFIYNLDRSSRILNRELIKKSKEGVKVRILVDYSAPVFKLNPYIAAFLKRSGIEIRYYNTAGTWQLFNVQHRSHRKLLIIDAQYVMTGGRNIADEYFDIGADYNFLDTDILIDGEISREIRNGFDVYWDSDLSKPAQDFETDYSNEELDAVISDIGNDEMDKGFLTHFMPAGEQAYNASFKTDCRDLSFVSDSPGASVAQRQVYKAILKEAAQAKKEIVIESPYFILKKDGLADFANITSQGVSIKILTNSLHSTDAFYTVSALFRNLIELNSANLEIWAYNSKPPRNAIMTKDIVLAERWGIHSKRAVIDDQTVIVGTYNIDPRSANLNSELILICRGQKDFSLAVLASIKERMAQSQAIAKSGCFDCWKNTFTGASVWDLVKFMVFIPIARQLDFLL